MGYHPTLRTHRPNDAFAVNKQKRHRLLRFQRKLKKKKIRVGYVLPVQQSYLYFNGNYNYLPLKLVRCPKSVGLNLINYAKCFNKNKIRKKKRVHWIKRIKKLKKSMNSKTRKKYIKRYFRSLRILNKRVERRKLRTVYKR